MQAKSTRPLQTIDADTLQSTAYEPVSFVVDDLLPQGLHLLAGAPKIGKSWLALWLCLCAAQGKPLWTFATRPCEVLYLCLEDSFQRIQSRLFDLTEDAPPTLHFAVMSQQLHNGLVEQIEQFLKEHPQTKLIVIDTLQRIRTAGNDANPYASDYRDIGVLKALADKHRIAILLVHHLRKMNDDDPMNMISGTTGLSGATDSNFVLRKSQRRENTATLYCTGRDIPYRELALEFDGEDHVWKLLSDDFEQKEQPIAEYSRNDRTEFIHTIQETQVAQQSADISKKRRRLAAAQKRAGELEKLICKIYEDNALGKLPDARYKALDAQYAKEQDALEIEIAELEKAVTGYEQSQKSAEKFIALIDKYENFDTLTNTMLNEFVEKILVHERARKGSQDTTQEIEIYFNFLGRYIPPSLQPVPLTPEEQEELRKKEERKDRLHQNYLKRKASGAQKRYEDKIKAKKKAEMDAKKALIRAEDMKKGVFSTIGQLPKEEPRKGSIAASAAV